MERTEMIVSKLKFEFSEACWAVANKSTESARRVFEQVAAKSEPKSIDKEMERMSLGELLFFALLEQGVQA
jgi:hypothetical protein